MEKIVCDKTCTGCSACANGCPKNAIQMLEDEHGFKYPYIDKSKCINCGICKKVCPVLKQQTDDYKEIKSYACYNKNIDERLNSSSGGIFILLATEIIKKNGIVFGACFNKDFNVEHSYADSIDGLKKFMGSKYSQSDLNNSYKKVKTFLDEDRYVLFTGTPCQVEGLKSYLGKDYKKLYTQDIVCHGVPSPKVWQKYLAYVNEDKPNSVNFRYKKDSWKNYKIKISYKSGEYIISHDDDLYFKAFLRNTSLRESCYNCQFKKKYRSSDITLADYWGISNIHRNLDDDKGISLVVVNSKKGEELFNNIKKNLIFEETDINTAVKYNSSMILSSKKDKKRANFFKELDNLPFDILVDKYTTKTPFYIKVKSKTKSIIKKILKPIKKDRD